MLTIATHNNTFHADEVFACAMLSFDPHEIVRTRDPDLLATADLRVDVGGKYNGTTDFDHHQEGGAGLRDNGIPYAASGLVWKHFGEAFLKSLFDDLDSEALAYMVKDVDARLIQGIDAMDTGHMQPDDMWFTVSSVVSHMNASPELGAYVNDKVFREAITVAKSILTSVSVAAFQKYRSARAFQEAPRYLDGRVVVLDAPMGWSGLEIEESLLYVVSPVPNTQGAFTIQQVPVTPGSFTGRKSLPKAWRGKRDVELKDLLGLSASGQNTFCHNGGFIGGAENFEDAMKMANLAVQSKRITRSSLCDRFYTRDGWTRSSVAEAHGTELKFVLPRYFNSDKDGEANEKCDRWVLPNDDGEYLDCDYFAVYEPQEAKYLNYSHHELVSVALNIATFEEGGRPMRSEEIEQWFDTVSEYGQEIQLSIQDVDLALQKIDELLHTDWELEIYLSDCMDVLREENGFMVFQCPECQGYGTYTYAYGEELQPHEDDMLLCGRCDGVGELDVKTSNWLAVNQAVSEAP